MSAWLGNCMAARQAGMEAGRDCLFFWCGGLPVDSTVGGRDGWVVDWLAGVACAGQNVCMLFCGVKVDSCRSGRLAGRLAGLRRGSWLGGWHVGGTLVGSLTGWLAE